MTTEQLSREAQAVLDAVVSQPAYATRKRNAAALRATVQELKYIGITEKNILAIVNELAQDPTNPPVDAL